MLIIRIPVRWVFHLKTIHVDLCGNQIDILHFVWSVNFSLSSIHIILPTVIMNKYRKIFNLQKHIILNVNNRFIIKFSYGLPSLNILLDQMFRSDATSRLYMITSLFHWVSIFSCISLGS